MGLHKRQTANTRPRKDRERQTFFLQAEKPFFLRLLGNHVLGLRCKYTVMFKVLLPDSSRFFHPFHIRVQIMELLIWVLASPINWNCKFLKTKILKYFWLMHAASKEIFQKYIIRHINFPAVPPTRNDYCFIIWYILGQMFFC